MELRDRIALSTEIDKSLRSKMQDFISQYKNISKIRQKSIYHYTNVNGLRGIIEGSSLWATGVAYLNDKEEVDHGSTVTQKAINEILNAPRVDGEFKVFAKVIGEGRLNNRADNTFVICFTYNGDQLSQWRGYSNIATGYSIEFSKEEMLQFPHDAAEKNWYLLDVFDDVIYIDQAKLDITKYVIQEYYDALINLKAGNHNIEISDFYSDCRSFLSDYLSLYKNNSFREEFEVRASFSLFFDNSSVNYRTQNGIFVPYLDIKKPEGKLPIKSITIGPNSDFERIRIGLSGFLEKNGYSEVVIKDSKIPYRT